MNGCWQAILDKHLHYNERVKKEQTASLIIQWQSSLNTDGGVEMNNFNFANGIDVKLNQIKAIALTLKNVTQLYW